MDFSVTKKPRTELKFNLLENGIDFIRSGIERYFLRDTAGARDHKYAVLHIFAGVLLLLKERLRKAHPSLIFKRVEDVAKEFSKDDVKTVTFDEAVERLRNCANVDIPANQLAALRTAQRIRNQLEHYEVSLDLKQTQAVVGRLCEFAYFFMRDHLNESLGQHLKGEVWHRVVELRGIARKLEEERLEEWRERASKYAKIPKSRLRHMKESIEPYHPKHNPNPEEVRWCSECGSENVVITEDRDIAVCANCRDVSEVTSCTRCGEPVVGGGTFCDDCQSYWDHQMSKD